MKNAKEPRKCSLCLKPGHRSDRCPDNQAPESARAPREELVSSEDVSVLKTAVSGVIEALEPVDARHRAKVIRSAQVILGEA